MKPRPDTAKQGTNLALADPKPLKTYSEAIYQHLRDAILDQQIQPSERLREKEIAGRFGVSITPVREAIRKLEGEGYVEARGHRGVRVRNISTAELIEIYRVIGVLDSYAASLAVPQMSPDVVRDLEARTDEMESYYHKRKIAECLQASMQIHALLWKLSGNRFLAQTLEQIRARLTHYPVERNVLHARPGVLKQSMTSHRNILKALKAGNVEDIQRICESHWMLLAGPSQG